MGESTIRQPQVFAGCYLLLLLPGFSRRYFCESFLRCPRPYPGGLLSAFAWCFPIIRLGRLSTLQLFRYVQASEFARLPDRSYRWAAEAFYSRAERASLPSHASDMHIRPTTGNWRTENFHLAR